MARWSTCVQGVSVTVLATMMTAASSGCIAERDDAERFREAVPRGDDVALRVPGGDGARGSSSGTTTQSIRLASPNASDGSVARYYQFTRDLTGAVDFGTATILGSVWTIVHQPPTTIEAKRAVWGPGQANALEPAIWRFTATEIADGEYDYVLEGQPKAGGAWLAVLRGHGFGKTHPKHHEGWFEADNEAYRTLDPTRARDYGSTKVTYDLRELPATIHVELRPGDERGSSDVTVTHENAGAGSVAITATSDLDDAKTTKLENIRLLSRWTSIGSGRADAILEGGDMPVTVNASECWSSSFARTFYKDTVDFEPAVGDASVCPFEPSKL